MGAGDAAVAHRQGTHNKPAGIELVEKLGGEADIEDAVEGTDFMEMNFFRLCAVHPALRSGDKAERGQRRLLCARVHAGSGDDLLTVSERAVFVLVRQADPEAPARDMLHRGGLQDRAAQKIGHDGGETFLQTFPADAGHPDKTGEHHVSGYAGIRAHRKDSTCFESVSCCVQ